MADDESQEPLDRRTLVAALRAAWLAEPLEDYPVGKADKGAFNYGRDCAYAAIDALLAGAK